jgi:murein DD-endopeptidase MepM/ murein hydrolase activator NlpD
MKIWLVYGFFIFMVGCSLLILGCSPSTESIIAPTITQSPTTDIPPASPTTPCTPYVRLTPASLPPTPTPQMEICSPLEGIALQDLPETIFNPFNPPVPGSDDPHQGIDFSDIDPVTQMALDGRSVQAALGGTVVAVIKDRFPYGNAVMIETSLDKLPNEWLHTLPSSSSTPNTAATINPRLTCPDIEIFSLGSSDDQSIYLLYAHLKTTVSLQPGEVVSCGQVFGQIGNSGNSLNPHLHLEARIGPTGSHFKSMAHYDASASLEEMANYCLWRVSGHFSLFDPMDLLSVSP